VLSDLGVNIENVAAEIATVRKDGSVVEGVGAVGSSGPRGTVNRYVATQPSTALRLVLFDRVETGAGNGEPVYVNPVDVVRVDPVDDNTSSITLRQGAAATVVVRGGVHEVSRRLTEL
jgi:hypothetical protein